MNVLSSPRPDHDLPGKGSLPRCLITGAAGFVGSHLAELLLAEGHAVCATHHRPQPPRPAHGLAWRPLDVLDELRVAALVAEVRPDFVFHLAAQTSIPLSWRDPESTFRANVLGTLHLLEGVRRSGLDPVVVVAGSSAEYGPGGRRRAAIREDRPLRPASPYGISKVAADLLGRLYWRTWGMRVVRVRPFQLIGPGKYPDACSEFARGIVEIERGEREGLSVGNLETVRDVMDVRDGVSAMWLLAQEGRPGAVYNICSGRRHRIGDLLAVLVGMAAVPVPLRQDPDRMRPGDEPIVVGDNSRLRRLGWLPRIALEDTLADLLAYWRRRAIEAFVSAVP